MVLAKEQTNRSKEQIESTEIDPYAYSQIFDKGVKAIQWRKESFQPMVLMLEQLDTFMEKKKKNQDTDLTTFIKINPKWIAEL